MERIDVREFRPDALGRVFAELRLQYDVDFSNYKSGTFLRRLQRRMAARGEPNLDGYVGLLRRDPLELAALYDDLLIGTTSFFREPAAFEVLKTIVFPRVLRNRHPDSPIRIWVPGCSTGEEAYSVAIALREFLGSGADQYKVEIFATDVHEPALAQARVATYLPRIEADISAERLKHFFKRVEDGYRVAGWVRSLIHFSRHNLAKDPPFSHIDLVTCRNVLIYMDDQLQRHVLRLLHYALNPEGFLLLGNAESVDGLPNAFSVVDLPLRLFAKKTVLVGMPLVQFVLRDVPDDNEPGKALSASLSLLQRRELQELFALADQAVIEHAPPRAIIDEACRILELRGRTEPFVEAVPDGTKPNIFQIVRPELREVLRTALSATAQGTSAESPTVPITVEGVTRKISVEVIPLTDCAECKARVVLFNAHCPASEVGSGPRGLGGSRWR